MSDVHAQNNTDREVFQIKLGEEELEFSGMASSISLYTNKRKPIFNTEKLLQFEDFADPSSFSGAIRLFLEKFGEIEDYTFNGMPIWSTLIQTENNGVLALYTVEETVQSSTVDFPFCDYCKLSGWGHHFLSKRKYHLVISGNNKPLKGNFAETQNHGLYGLIHCNGYGHLVCANGSRNNANYFTAGDAMELWNDLCTILQARKISVRDDLATGGINLRLIYGVAYGKSWFGRWDYKYSGESIGITDQEYDWAIQFLTSVGLDRIIVDFKKRRNGNKITQLIRKYRELSEKPLITISDLLRFMLGYDSGKIRNSGPSKGKGPVKFKTLVDSMVKGDCRWSARRLEDVLSSVVISLKDHPKGSMSRHELREETRKSIGDTGLIDFVLKSIKCFQVDNHVIRRVIDPSAKRVEFTIRNVAVKEKESSAKWPFINYDCKWSPDKLESAIELVMNILMENNSMTQLELYGIAKKYISDRNLIDFVLKALNISQIGNRIVYRTNNPITKRIEFVVAATSGISPSNYDIGKCFHPDVQYIYDNVLLAEYLNTSSMNIAIQILLESKQFVKEWQIEKKVVNHMMKLTCQVLPSFEELETELTRRLSPGVVVVVPPWINVRELKQVVQSTLRDTYCVMDEFEVRQVGGLKAVEDWRVLSSIVEPGGHIWIRGSGLDLLTEFRYEDGA